MESILLAWYYNNTRRSLLAVILVHALMNAQTFPTWGSPESAITFVAIWTVLTLAVVLLWKSGRLGSSEEPGS